jgi:hypothetical protein
MVRAPTRLALIAATIVGCAPATTRQVQSSDAAQSTTIVQQGPGELEFTLQVSPLPIHPGDTIEVTIGVRNIGDEPTQVTVPTCYMAYLGNVPLSSLAEVTCQAAGSRRDLAAGESWSLSDRMRVEVGRVGRHPFEVRVAEIPEVSLALWLKIDPKVGGM